MQQHFFLFFYFLLPTVVAVFEMIALGMRYQQAGHLDQAEELYRQVLKVDGGHAQAHHLLGIVAYQRARFDQAVLSIQRAVKLQPTVAAFQTNLGLAFVALGRMAEALACFQETVKLQPDSAEAHLNLASALLQNREMDAAEENYRQALRLRPEYADAHSGLGAALADQARLDEAIAHFRHALRIRPDVADIHCNLATALQHQGKLEEAAWHFKQALRLKADVPEAQQSLALQLLLRGDFEKGWSGYEWRWRQPGAVRRDFSQPLWDGSDLNGRTILLYAEQGLGDTLQFIRYARLAKIRHGGKVIVECQASLVRLLAPIGGIDCLVAHGSPLPAFEVRAPLLSLPGIMHTSLATIPSTVPYLQGERRLVEHWRKKLERLGGLKVGIAWQGNPAFRSDCHRSIPLSWFARLARLEGVFLISLQKGPGAEQLSVVSCQLSDNRQSTTNNFQVLDLGSKLDDASGAFMDTAAIIMNLDLVVCSDTAVAHLAGAMGVPVWLALALVPDWRWLLERADSPWYPTMRLFRQKHYGDWEEVFDHMADALKQATS
jgi:tetratricopeptide (TPR) repeat protein